jgi:hypothetical protein
MARSPKGSIAHSIPSFYPRRMATSGGGGFSLSLGDIGAIGLLNNSNIGEWLAVWDVQVYANPAGTVSSVSTIDFLFYKGIVTPITVTVQNTGGSLVDQQGQLHGIVWANKINFELGQFTYSLSLPPQGYQWVHNWPMAYVAPGDSWYVASDGSATQQFSACFTWEVVNVI